MTISERNDADLVRPMTRAGTTHASSLPSPAHVNGRTASVERSWRGGTIVLLTKPILTPFGGRRVETTGMG